MNNVIKISEHFWIFEEDGVRSFLFEGEERAMLIDTGCNRDFKPVYMHPAEMEHYAVGA